MMSISSRKDEGRAEGSKKLDLNLESLVDSNTHPDLLFHFT
jgi:hypothetical protein